MAAENEIDISSLLDKEANADAPFDHLLVETNQRAEQIERDILLDPNAGEVRKKAARASLKKRKKKSAAVLPPERLVEIGASHLAAIGCGESDIDPEATKKLLDNIWSNSYRSWAKFFRLEFDDEQLNAQQKVFLTVYAMVGTETYAARAAGVSLRACTAWHGMGHFELAFRRAEKAFADRLVSDAMRKAVVGEKRLKFHQGNLITVPKDLNDPDSEQVPYVERRKDTQLHIKLLEALLPEKFAPKNLSIVNNNQQMTVNPPNGQYPSWLEEILNAPPAKQLP